MTLVYRRNFYRYLNIPHRCCKKKVSLITIRRNETENFSCHSGISAQWLSWDRGEKKCEYRVRKIKPATSRETCLISCMYLLTTSTFSCEFFTIKEARTGIKALRRPVSMQIYARNTDCLLLAFRHLISRVNIPLVGQSLPSHLFLYHWCPPTSEQINLTI